MTRLGGLTTLEHDVSSNCKLVAMEISYCAAIGGQVICSTISLAALYSGRHYVACSIRGSIVYQFFRTVDRNVSSLKHCLGSTLQSIAPFEY